MKKWILNNDAVSEAIPEDLKSVGNTKQVEVESNTEGSSVLRLQFTFTEDGFLGFSGTNKEFESCITQRNVLLLISPVFDSIVCSFQCSHETTSDGHLG